MKCDTRVWFLSPLLALFCLSLASSSAHAVSKEVLQDIWIEHLVFRSVNAESPVLAEKELRLVLLLAPQDVRGAMLLAEHYMAQEHWLGTAMVAGLGTAWYPDDVAFEVFKEETTVVLNLNSQAADVPRGEINALLATLREIPYAGRGQQLLDFEINKLRPFLLAHPHSKDLLLVLSQVFQGRKEWFLLCAVNLYALDVAGETLPFVNNLVLGLSELKRYEEAERWILEWLVRYPKDRTLLAHRALLAIKQGVMGHDLLRPLNAWIEVDASNIQPYGLRARTYVALKQYQEAERDLFACIRINSDDSQAYLTLIQVALREGDPQQALGWLKKYKDRVESSKYRNQLKRLRQDEAFRKAEESEK